MLDLIKNKFLILIALALTMRLMLAWYFPMSVDELNVWNNFNSAKNFSNFWQIFIQYDTHQPLFYVVWYSFFKSNYSPLLLRLPSVLLYAWTIHYWKKSFSFEENPISWMLFLFAPFLVFYSTLFLPYSLLLLTSVYNFYRFRKLQEKFTGMRVFIYFLSCLLLIFTHYYGALQALLVSSYFIYRFEKMNIKILFVVLTGVLMLVLLLASDFINDFSVLHNYRSIPTLFFLMGDMNLLMGGKYVLSLLIILALMKKKINVLKSKEFVYVLTVIIIAYFKSILISPSLEARYLLILIYPLYFLVKDLRFRLAIPVLLVTCLISLYILEKSFGPSFVINYEKIKRTKHNTGLLITPCPKFYFREDNYICKNYFQDEKQLVADIKEMIVHRDHLVFYGRIVPTSKCQNIGEGLFSCLTDNGQL